MTPLTTHNLFKSKKSQLKLMKKQKCKRLCTIYSIPVMIMNYVCYEALKIK